MIRSFSLLLLSAAIVHAISEDDFFETRSAVDPNSAIEPRKMVAPDTARQETSYPCTTRKHAQCNGIPVSECPKLYTLYSKVTKGHATEAEKDVLRDAYCNFRKFNELIVCCESNPRPNPEPLQCGKNPLNKNTPRVVGGRPATLGGWPWMTALYVLDIYTQNTTRVCGGSLIGSEWVLTAAHCIPTKPNEILVKVRLGDLDLNSTVQDGANPIDRGVSLAIIHPKYSREKILNDIALLRLREPVKYTDYIRPICLRTSIFANESTYLKMKPTVIGWGGTYYGDPNPPTHLQEVDLNVVSQKDCHMKYVHTSWINEINVVGTNVCASAPGKDACRGDSGGPLMFLDSDLSWTLGGIVSFGKGCADHHFPGVYTKVSSYIPWIKQKTNLKF